MPNRYFQIGGSLPYNANSYVTRKADEELFAYLKADKFCYVLTARQLGKSSLRVRAMKRLEQLDFQTVYIDMTQIGSKSVRPDQWYYSLIVYISESLHILDEFDAWEIQFATKNITPISLFSLFIRNFLLPRLEKKLIVFMDEIDAILSLDRDSFNTDDFFAVIRSFYNERADHPEFMKINFALFGVAHPNDLMKDVTRTPFNIGEAITLDNFQFEEAKAAFLSGLSHIQADPEILLKEVFKHTHGQPYLTQKLCARIAEDTSVPRDEMSFVHKNVNQLFFHDRYDRIDPNLANINNRIIKNKAYNLKMLQLYKRILAGEKVSPNQTDFTQVYLKLSGLVIEQSGRLVINNRIYRKYFNQDWINNSLDKLDRPYTKDLQRWIDKGKNDPATALRGDLLQEAIEWKKEREDLSREEQEFFEFSQLIEAVEEIKSTRAEYSQKLNRKIKTQRNILILLNVSIVLFLATAINSYFLIEKNKKLVSATEELSQQTDSLTNVRDSLLLRNSTLGDDIGQKESLTESLRLASRDWQDSVAIFRDSLLTNRKAYDEQKKQLKQNANQQLQNILNLNNNLKQQEQANQQLQQSLDELRDNALALSTQFEQQSDFFNALLIEDSKIELQNQTSAPFLLSKNDETLKVSGLKHIRVKLKLKKISEKLPDTWLKLDKTEQGEEIRRIERLLPSDKEGNVSHHIKADYLKPGNYTLKIVLLFRNQELELERHKFQLE